MSTPVPSNKFLNTTLRAVAAAVIAAADTVDAATGTLRVMLTHKPYVQGQSPDGVNPTCDDVFNQVDLPTIELVDRAMSRVLQAAQAVTALHKQVYAKVHQTHWERRRQSPVHRASTPSHYVAPAP